MFANSPRIFAEYVEREWFNVVLHWAIVEITAYTHDIGIGTVTGNLVMHFYTHLACCIFIKNVNPIDSSLVTAAEIPAIDNVNLHKLQEVPRNRIDIEIYTLAVDIASPLHSRRCHKRAVGKSDVNDCGVLCKALGKGIAPYL